MFKKIVLISLSILLFSTFLSFAQKEESALDVHLKKITERVKRLKTKQKSRVTTVAGLRGVKVGQSKQKLYWKGKREVSEKELDAFNIGIEYARLGKYDEATSCLENFIKLYTKSILVKEAKDTINLIKESQKK